MLISEHVRRLIPCDLGTSGRDLPSTDLGLQSHQTWNKTCTIFPTIPYDPHEHLSQGVRSFSMLQANPTDIVNVLCTPLMI